MCPSLCTSRKSGSRSDRSILSLSVGDLRREKSGDLFRSKYSFGYKLHCFRVKKSIKIEFLVIILINKSVCSHKLDKFLQ